ncbi:MAG: hypothetical protein HY901_34815, partial [Deltaproteobacteria bacterium]|nr:hypothetical protein [Deltaproteobacteria bacterium]
LPLVAHCQSAPICDFDTRDAAQVEDDPVDAVTLASPDVEVWPDAGDAAGDAAGGPDAFFPGGPDEPIPPDPGVAMPFVHPLFGDHMVLQRDALTPVWGWAAPGDEVQVTIAGKAFLATADEYGRWLVRVGPFEAGGPYTLAIDGPRSITFEGVIFGDVWLCSGQSNMQWSVFGSSDAGAAIAASDDPDIRLLTVPMVCLKSPRQTFPPRNVNTADAGCEIAPNASPNAPVWKTSSPASVPSFSAVCYFFGRALHEELGVPIGLIHSSWGGTPIEAWTSTEALATIEDYHAALGARATAEPKQLGPKSLATLYNGMIAPLLPFAIKGAIWYQGESNAAAGAQYSRLLPNLIHDWRSRFRMGQLDFLTVQLANFHPQQVEPVQEGWALLRESQLHTALNDPRGGFAVTIDLGEAANIHPANKQDVGGRLAISALKNAYGRNVPGGVGSPLYSSMKIEGAKIRVSFANVGSGLMVGTKTGLSPAVEDPHAKLRSFAIAGASKSWVWADAVIDGASVVVSSAQVANPVAVRYGWADNPPCNLYNREGFPASPFRTDLDYTLSVVNGTGGGAYARGRTVTVHADLPNAGAFDRWVGDVSDLDDPTSATTNLKMPAKYVSIRATYRN